MLLAQLLKIWPRFLSVTIYFYHICFMPRLGRYSTMLTHSPAIKPPSYLWFLLATWLWFTVLPPPASSLLLLSFSSSLPGAFWTYTPTFLLHCPITDSSLYWLVKMGRRFTWNHLNTWWTAGLGQPSWRSRINIRIRISSGQSTTGLNKKRSVGWESWKGECSGWAITGYKEGWETSQDIVGPRDEERRNEQAKNVSTWGSL